MQSDERAAARQLARVTIVALIAVMFACGSAVAAPASSITSCGTKIEKSGSYVVADNLYDESGGASDCIDVLASNVTLNIENKGDSACDRLLIQGDGSSKVGIYISPGARNANILGNGAIVAGWGIGIEDDGNSAFGTDFYLTNNASDGLLVSNANNSTFLQFSSGLLVDATGSPCFPSLHGQEQGVRIQNTISTQISFASLEGNLGDGFSEAASKLSEIKGVISGGNLNGFEFVGGFQNRVEKNFADFPRGVSSIPNTDDGFDIGSTEKNDSITRNQAFGNGNGTTTFDIDSNGDKGCRRNSYSLNKANTFDEPCVVKP